MDRILKILKKENGPRASSAPALELNTIIFKHVYWYMQLISGERLQDHWSSGFFTQPWLIAMLPSLKYAGGQGVILYDGPDLFAIHLVCWGRSLHSLAHRGSTGVFAPDFQ